jgi:hypothetical protein
VLIKLIYHIPCVSCLLFLMFQRDSLNLEPSNVANCVSKGKSEVSTLSKIYLQFVRIWCFGLSLFRINSVKIESSRRTVGNLSIARRGLLSTWHHTNQRAWGYIYALRRIRTRNLSVRTTKATTRLIYRSGCDWINKFVSLICPCVCTRVYPNVSGLSR